MGELEDVGRAEREIQRGRGAPLEVRADASCPKAHNRWRGSTVVASRLEASRGKAYAPLGIGDDGNRPVRARAPRAGRAPLPSDLPCPIAPRRRVPRRWLRRRSARLRPLRDAQPQPPAAQRLSQAPAWQEPTFERSSMPPGASLVAQRGSIAKALRTLERHAQHVRAGQ